MPGRRVFAAVVLVALAFLTVARQLDYRDEIMAQIFDRGDPTPKRRLTFHIELTDEGGLRGEVFGAELRGLAALTLVVSERLEEHLDQRGAHHLN